MPGQTIPSASMISPLRREVVLFRTFFETIRKTCGKERSRGPVATNLMISACNAAANRTSHEAVPRNTRSAASGTAAVVTRRVSTHSIRDILAAKQGSSRQNATNSAHHRAAVAPHRYCFAILPRRARRVAEASPCRAAWSLSAAPSLRRLPPRCHSPTCHSTVEPSS